MLRRDNGNQRIHSPVEAGTVARDHGVLRSIVFPVRFDGPVCAISPYPWRRVPPPASRYSLNRLPLSTGRSPSGRVEPLAVIDNRQRDRLLALNVVDAQRLGRPAGDREIGVAADPFELEVRAQPVVAADVITEIGRASGRERVCQYG